MVPSSPNGAQASVTTGVAPVRILVADDHDAVRFGVTSFLSQIPGFEICGEATDGPDALRKAAALHPDILILDLMLPDLTGFEVAIRMRQVAGKTRIVFFSMHEVPTAARECGAEAFVSKASGLKELFAAVERIADSIRWPARFPTC